MDVKIALAQFGGRANRDENLDKIESLARQAAANGAQIICFPELSTTIYFCFERNEQHFTDAEPVPGPSTERIGALARELGVAIILPLFEVENDRRYNSIVLLGPDGDVIGRYRKNAIPQVLSVLKPGETPGDEKFYFDEGNLGFPVFDTPFGVKVGMVVCFDRHFPEGPRILGVKGADIMFVPTASYRSFYKEGWEVELRAHAMMNLYYVAGVNKVGPEEGGVEGRHYFGTSMIVAPGGTVMAKASGETEDIIYAKIDPATVAEQRRIWGFYRDRRPELYTDLARKEG